MDSDNSGISHDTKNLITILLLVFVYPVGLILMWIWMKWKTWVKVLVSLPIVLIILGLASSVLLVAINPAAQVKKAECVTSCEKNYQKNSSEYNLCVTECINPAKTEESNAAYPDKERNELINECVSGGATEEACTCIINHIQTEISWEEMSANMDSPSDAVSAKFNSALQKGVELCQ